MLHFRQEMRGENSDQRSPLAVSTASRLQDDTLRSLILMSFRLWTRFNWFSYMFHESMISWALYSATIAIKNGKYTVPFFERLMDYILFHFKAWATYKSHNIDFSWALYSYHFPKNHGFFISSIFLSFYGLLKERLHFNVSKSFFILITG